MGETRKTRGGRSAGRPAHRDVPLPLDAVNLLAGIAPGVELDGDGVLAADGVDTGAPSVTVDDVGRMLRTGDATIRRLIRGQTIGDGTAPRGRAAGDRAGVEPRSRRRPGE